ncbi:MAG: DNA cytosine methyltransferase, partial [Gemmatimonadaceae bacterium]|nr:DNA cytosine methyltransferase [Gemmatimonadaceae bacterium]
MRLLDLFCGGGGAAMGYHRASFEVVGVDVNAQPRYPFEFHQADALEFPLEGFDAIHASPPCQAFSTIAKQRRKMSPGMYEHPDLVEDTRNRLLANGKPYVIENVMGAPLIDPIRLCGSSFGLDIRRHRLFECGGWTAPLMPPCAHHWQKPRFRSLDQRRKGALATVVGVHGHLNYAGEADLRKQAIDIDWMTNDELSQAIPPAYTEFIG